MRYFVRLLLVIFALTLFGCASYKPLPPAPLVNFQPTVKVSQVWAKSAGVGAGSNYLRLTPAIDNNTIFVANYDGKISALNAMNGRSVWAINTKLSLTSGIAASNGVLTVGTGDGYILAIKQNNGASLWYNPVSSEILATPTIAQNIVITKVETGEIAAFDLLTGKRLWTYNNIEPGLILRGSSSVRVYDNYVIAGFASGQLVALDLKSGKLLWKQAIVDATGSTAVQRMVDIDVNPQIVAGVIYVATYQGNVAAITLKTGRILWQHQLSSYSGLAVDKGRVYVSDADSYLWAFDATTGAVDWKSAALANRNITGPATVNGLLVVGDMQGYLHFMAEDDGHFVARDKVASSGINDAPLVVDNALYAVTNNGRVAKYLV